MPSKKLFETEKTGDEDSAGAGNFVLDPALGAALLAHAAAVVVVVEEPFSVSSISSALQFTSTYEYDTYFLKKSLFPESDMVLLVKNHGTASSEFLL